MDNHFSTFDYDAELPKHITEYFVERKCGKILMVLARRAGGYTTLSGMMGWGNDAPIKLLNKPSGIDFGCGRGHHVRWFRKKGFRVVGIDSHLNYKSSKEGIIAKYDMRDFHILDGVGIYSFSDFIYTINVLHHLKNREDQIKAIREAARILKKGGLFIVMEMNFKNLLIALYVKHIFPCFRRYDFGIECWFDKKLFDKVLELKLIKTDYFTFTPDFCPKWLLPLFKKIDEWADGKWIAKFGAHVMYVMEKQ